MDDQTMLQIGGWIIASAMTVVAIVLRNRVERLRDLHEQIDQLTEHASEIVRKVNDAIDKAA